MTMDDIREYEKVIQAKTNIKVLAAAENSSQDHTASTGETHVMDRAERHSSTS